MLDSIAALPRSRPLLSVIVPAFNEERTVAHVVQVLSEIPLDMEIVVVDDCSIDKTPDILAELSQIHKRLRVIRHQQNSGKTAAVRTGLAATSGEIVIIQDADMEQDPAEIPAIIQPIVDGKAKASFGSRFLTKEARRSMPFKQFFGNRCVTIFSNLISGLRLTDVETGYKAIRGEIFRRMILTSSGFGLEVEIPAKLAKLRIPVHEVPVSYNARNYDAGKKIGVWDGVVALWYVFKFNFLCRLGDSFRPEEQPRATPDFAMQRRSQD